MDWQNVNLFLLQYYAWFGLTGSGLILFCMLIAGFIYKGEEGERYSLRNHYVSELGKVGVSRGAVIFNAGLILGGILFIPFNFGLGMALDGGWAKAGMITGGLAAFSCIAVGLFPLNHFKPHVFAAVSFFRLGLAMVFFYSIAIFLQPNGLGGIPKISNIAGLSTFVFFTSFILAADVKKANHFKEDLFDPGEESARPAFSPVMILEWAAVLSTIFWFLILALFELTT